MIIWERLCTASSRQICTYSNNNNCQMCASDFRRSHFTTRGVDRSCFRSSSVFNRTIKSHLRRWDFIDLPYRCLLPTDIICVISVEKFKKRSRWLEKNHIKKCSPLAHSGANKMFTFYAPPQKSVRQVQYYFRVWYFVISLSP